MWYLRSELPSAASITHFILRCVLVEFGFLLFILGMASCATIKKRTAYVISLQISDTSTLCACSRERYCIHSIRSECSVASVSVRFTVLFLCWLCSRCGICLGYTSYRQYVEPFLETRTMQHMVGSIYSRCVPLCNRYPAKGLQEGPIREVCTECLWRSGWASAISPKVNALESMWSQL